MMIATPASRGSVVILRVATMPSTLGIRTSRQYHVGSGARHNGERVTSIDSLANNLKIITVGQQGTQPAAYQRLIICQHYPDHASDRTSVGCGQGNSAVTTVPAPR
jgi:hypothetical protein